MSLTTGPAGIELIKRNEGCKLTAFLDEVANPPVWTIGYGCTGPRIVRNLTITQAQAEEMLATRLAQEFEPGVLAAIGPAPTTQSQFDAMVSLAWNIGVGAFAKSTVARLHKAGDYAGAAAAFELWDHAGGQVNDALLRRRKEEASLYLSNGAVPGPVPAPGPKPGSGLNVDYLLVLQAFMQASGDYAGELDGLDGPLTRASVAAIRQRAS
jgi:lysozyme